MLNEILFLLLAFLGAVISATIGFGSAIILLPFSSLLLPIKEAIAIVTIFFMASNISRIVIFYKYIDWKNSILILIGAVPMVIVGAFLMVSAPSDLLEKLLALIIIFYIINDLLGLTKKIKLKKYMIILISGLYGFFTGIIGTGSSIKVALLNLLGLTKERFIATIAIIAIVLNIIKTFIYARSHLIGTEDVPLIIALVCLAFSGAFVGKNFVKRIKPALFKQLVLVVLAIVSIKLLFF